MSRTDYEKLKKSIDNLMEQYRHFLAKEQQKITEVERKSTRNSVILCFTVCYDTLWKQMKKFLQEEENLADVPNSPRGIFRRAHEAGLIDRGMLEHLMNYNSLRGSVSHDYSEMKAGKVFEYMEDFSRDASEMYKIMTEE